MFLCAGILFIWSYKRIGRIGACFALLALLAIHPLWLNHCARTGDADSLFILLCTISTLCLAEACAGRAAFMIVSCFSISLAFLTKSFHAMILIMELGVALCILRKSIRMTRSIIWLSLLALILPAGLWAFLRYQKDGLTFLSEMFLTDVLNRSMTAMEDHGGGLMSYFELNFILL